MTKQKVRIITYYPDNAMGIRDIYEFDMRTRKDGLSKPLCDMLWVANQDLPEGGRIMITFSNEDGTWKEIL